MKKNQLLIFLLLLQFSVYSQVRSKFGKVSLKEIQMKFYERDSSANAVILFDHGYFDEEEFRFTRHVRVKILKKQGLNWANWTLRTRSKGMFKALIFNEENGTVIQDKLKVSNIHKERVIDDVFFYKLFMPSVKVGSVIDLKYSFNGIPYEWRFQDIIPIAHSELKIEPTKYLEFKKRVYGFEEITRIGVDHWMSKDMPAFAIENHISHYSNYISKIEFELSEISYPGWSNIYYYSRPYFKEFTTSWDNVSAYLDDIEPFGQQIRGCNFLNRDAKDIANSSLSDIEKVHKVYQYIKDKIKWNGFHTIYATGTLRDNFEVERSGNIAQINLPLVSMLRKVGFDAWPVVLSTKDNGLLFPHSASIDKLNYVVCYVEYNGESALLDASQLELEPGILPKKCLNGEGWLVDGKTGRWVDLTLNNKKVSKTYSKISLIDNQWTATVSISHENYNYIEWKEEYKKSANESEYLRKFEEKNPLLNIESYQLTKDDKGHLKASERYKLNIEEFVLDLGAEITIDPFIIKDFNSNIFMSTKRKYPITLETPINFKQTVIINIPEHLSLGVLPESEKISLPNNSGFFTYRANLSGNNIQIQCSVQIKRLIYPETDYILLKTFYSEMIKKMNQPLILTKT